jgi:hypothetical protein
MVPNNMADAMVDTGATEAADGKSSLTTAIVLVR